MKPQKPQLEKPNLVEKPNLGTPEHFTGNVSPPQSRFDPALPLCLIAPSPLNPRKRFDPDALAELADSIRQHGVQQPLVVRHDADGYEIVMGERRFRAARLAGLEAVPALIRTDIDARLHAELALVENIQRNDLTPMETARGYKQCLDLGSTQAQLGEKAGVTQSRIANLVRLLELPGDVQDLIDAGTLSAGHGIQLARYKDFPALCSHLAKMAVGAGWPVRTLEAGLTHQTTAMANQVGLVQSFGYSTVFDWKETCVKSCPFHAYRGASDRQEGGYCLKPDHFQELQKAAIKERDAEAERTAARLRDQAIAQANAAKEKLETATTKSGRVEAEQERQQAETVKKALAKGLPELRYGEIEELRGGCPAECAAGTCPCHIQAREKFSGNVVPACADLRRKRKIEAAATKEKNKPRKEFFDGLRAQVEAFPWGRVAFGSGPEARRAAALIAWSFLRNCKAQAKKEVAVRMLAAGSLAPVRALLLNPGYMASDAEAYAALASVSTGDILAITAEIFLRDELIERYDYGGTTAEKTTWFLQKPSEGENADKIEPEKSQPETSETNPLFPCADCQVADTAAFYVDANGMETYKEDIGGSWVCAGCQAKRTVEAAENLLTCAGCGAAFPDDAFGELNWAAARTAEVRMTSGHLLLPSGEAFCDQCGPLCQGGFMVGDRVGAKFGADVEAGTIKDIAPFGGHITARIVFDNIAEQLVRVNRLTSCPTPLSNSPAPEASQDAPPEENAEDADDWSYDPKPSLDDNFCRSCGVIPLTGAAMLCPQCDPLTRDDTLTREEAALA